MSKLSIKKIKHLIELEKPKAIARYLRRYLPENKRSITEVRLDEYAHSLVKAEGVDKQAVLKMLEKLKSVKG